ncbi:FAD/NAD(P)-binding domain-containing protein [Melanomma pulvis-pyrius CBS 109.77]|uniref:FAD/NAD(P)-binding domain-containing protein n=1 Tax=Melanomma pulvis-pyrius CBS 109.77 TaxID=1314802 RepID=A0A6A6X5G3_9PLEO|nr:FAD/NAD(P)-binding domain-containing protein [Melanomma pulvis-pyrius CBS 109.77]
MVHFRTDIAVTNPHVGDNNDSYAKELETDVLIVGAGFGGVYLMHKLRQLGFNCKIYEAGKELGGIWHWNCYPGARVDTQVPIYEYSIPEVWKDWTWSEKYPGFQELRAYFEHVEKVLDVKKDVAFDTRVVGAHFDKPSSKWIVETEDGRTAKARYLLLATGFAAKRHFPDWMGIDTFKGEMHHSSFWPDAGVDVKGKRVAVIGTGSTGVQIAQETAKTAASVTVFQRTPNLSLPMRQAKLTKEEQQKGKSEYPKIYKNRMTTFAGFQYDFADRNTFDDTPEEREAFYEERFKNGGFEFWLANYKDLLFDKKANTEAYNFWAKKTRARISDPVKRDILAPLTPPHAFGTKRPSLEQNFYELMDKPENEVVDIKKTPIVEVTETGIKTEDGKVREFDVIALATGFDSVTGGMKNMGLKDIDGIQLSEKWKTGTWSYLGMTCAGYPNMFFLYGAQGPTAFSNGPSCVECQGDWIVDAIKKLKEEDIKYIDVTKEAEEEWRRKVTEISDKTLFPGTSSWYMGANVPGKPREQLNYAGGIPLYEKECREALDNGFQGFITA